MNIPYSVLNQLKHAIFLPAIQTQFSRGVIKSKAVRPLPNGASTKDLNFFEPNSKFFHLPAALYSAGLINNHRNPPPCMVTKRLRGLYQNTLVMGDSGGYQVLKRDQALNANEQRDTYDWLVKYCDLAMTLDVPTARMYLGRSARYLTLDDCLSKTMGYLAAFKSFGAENEFFLNVLQGEGGADADVWYDAVKHYDFYGWAFAGPDKTKMKNVLYRVLALIEDGKFDKDETWLHFLGVGDLKTAVLLTTLRDVLRHKFPNCRIEVSYDTSTAFMMGGRNLTALDKPILSSSQLTIPHRKIDKHYWAGNSAAFPYGGSEISKYLTKGDIIIQDWKGVKRPDNLGYLMLQNHNVEVQASSIDAIHQLLKFGLTPAELRPLVPTYLVEAQDAIKQVLLKKSVKAGRQKLFEKSILRVLDDAYKAGHRPGRIISLSTKRSMSQTLAPKVSNDKTRKSIKVIDLFSNDKNGSKE